MERALLETQHAFDGVASDYDRSNAVNQILAGMRRRMLETIVAHVPEGGRILDLGCGPGTDDESLARSGYAVTAIDWSPAMVDETRKRIARGGLEDRVGVHHLGIHELGRLSPESFDAACSNFGPLNCVPDLADAARQIAERVRPGGSLIASVIGRVCPWEIALYGARGEWSRLRVRFSTRAVAVPLNERTVWTHYYSPAQFEAVFEAAGFRRVSLRSLGLFVPPPYMHAFAARHPRLLSWLEHLEDRAGAWPGVRAWGDHFLIVMKKV
jgi:SAM-dependent methyltransferase